MPYTSHPIWPFQHNWSETLPETLEWKTDVLAGDTGNEQRIPRRLTPRRSFQATFLLQSQELQYYEHFMATYGSSVVLLPVWHAITRTTAAMQALIHEIPLDAQYREYRADEWIILRGATPQIWEAHTVESVESDRINFVADAAEVYTLWPQGAIVYPGILAQISETARSSKKTDMALEVTIRFTSAQPNPHESNWSPALYLGVPVLETPPDDSEELASEHQRLLSPVDNTLGLPNIYDMAGKQFKSYEYRWSAIGREKANEMRRILYWLRGRTRALWLPTFMEDLVLATPTVAWAVNMVVKNVGYARFGMHARNRNILRVQLGDGTVYYRNVIAAAVIDSTKELLGLSEPWPAAFTPDQVARISYMIPARLDQDSLEINHLTDLDGVSQCVGTWREFGALGLSNFFKAPGPVAFEGVGDNIQYVFAVAIYQTPETYRDNHTFTDYIYNPLLHEFWLAGYMPNVGPFGITRLSAATGEIVGHIGLGGGANIAYNPYLEEVYVDGVNSSAYRIDAATGFAGNPIAWPNLTVYNLAGVNPVTGQVVVFTPIVVDGDADPTYLQYATIKSASTSGVLVDIGTVPVANGWLHTQFFDKNGIMWDALNTNSAGLGDTTVLVRRYAQGLVTTDATYQIASNRAFVITVGYDFDHESMWVVVREFVTGTSTVQGSKLYEFNLLTQTLVAAYDITAYGLPVAGFGDFMAYDTVNGVIWYHQSDHSVVGVRTKDGSLFGEVDLASVGVYSIANLFALDGALWGQADDANGPIMVKIWRRPHC